MVGVPRWTAPFCFVGVNGFLDTQAQQKVREADGPLPQFRSRAGEPIQIPPKFVAAVRAVARSATCVGYSHAHYLTNSAPATVNGMSV